MQQARRCGAAKRGVGMHGVISWLGCDGREDGPSGLTRIEDPWSSGAAVALVRIQAAAPGRGET